MGTTEPPAEQLRSVRGLRVDVDALSKRLGALAPRASPGLRPVRVDSVLRVRRMSVVRLVSIVAVLVSVLAAVGVFFVYGGQRADVPSPREPMGRAEETDSSAASDPFILARFDALSKRIDALTEDLARIRQSQERVQVPVAGPAEPADGLLPSQRKAVLLMIAEDQDRRLVKDQTQAVTSQVVQYVVENVPDLGRFPFQEVVDILVAARLQYGEIRRRLVPLDQEPGAEGPWKLAFDQEVAELRESRRTQLIQLVGIAAADGCILASQFVYRIGF